MKLADSNIIPRWKHGVGDQQIETWQKAFQSIHKITLHPDFRYLQFRILNRNLGVGQYTQYVKPDLPSSCTFCSLAGLYPPLETPEHLFFYCPVSSIILSKLQQWAPMKLLQCQVNAFNILIWHDGDGKQFEFLRNSAIIWYTQFIFNCKKDTRLPNAVALFKFITKQAQDMHAALTNARKHSQFDIFTYPDDYVRLSTGLVKIFYR